MSGEQLHRCRSCQTNKTADEFYRDSRRSTGLQSDCRACCAAKQRARARAAKRPVSERDDPRD